MNTTLLNIKKYALIAILTTTCITASAQYRLHRHYVGPHVTAIVAQPAVTVKIDNRLTQKERFQMAIAYLNKNKYLTIKKYAKMTGLNKKTAEAELDAFTMDKSKPIACVIVKKKKLYTKR